MSHDMFSHVKDKIKSIFSAGKNCSDNEDGCLQCVQDYTASCVDTLDSYTCLCVDGYTGINCEVSKLCCGV